MRKILLILIFIPVALSAQNFPYSSEYSDRAVRGIENISASIISDAFSPMTHYSEGNEIISVVPAYFTVERLMKDPDIECDNFNGKAFGAGYGRAMTDNFMMYVILAGMKMGGDLEYAAYGSQFGVINNRVDYSLLSVLGGGGCDLIDNEIFSMPVFFGVHMQYYSAEISSDPVTWTDMVTYNVDMKTSGSGLLYGISGGVAFSLKIPGNIKITPYFLYMRNFNKAELESSVTLENLGIEYKNKFSFDTDPVSAGMTGISIGYESDSGFSFSIAMGSMLSSLAGKGSEASGNGVKMKSLVLIFSYNL